MCPLIGISRPTQRSRGTPSGVRLRLAVRVDPVVHDLEALVVEALDVLEIAREPARDRDVDVREARERTVGEPEVRGLAELVEPVLRREAERDAGDRTREETVRVGVHEVRVQDRRAARASGTRSSRTKANGSKSARSGIASSGTPRARSARAKSQAPGSFSWSISIRTSQPRSRSRGSSERRCASEPEMPATFCRWRTVPGFIGAATVARSAVGPVLDGVVAPRRARAAPAGGAGRARAAAPRGLGIVAAEAELGGQQVVEDRVRREHGQARRSRLVDDLVGRAGAHVVHEHVAAREELRECARAAPARRDRASTETSAAASRL